MTSMSERPSERSGSNGVVKLCIVGAAQSGKTMLCERLQRGNSPMTEEYVPTIGVDFKLTRFEDTRMHIWDTSGDVRFLEISRCYFRPHCGVIITYDSGRPETLEEVPEWLSRVRRQGEPAAVLLCATKDDLSDAVSLPRTSCTYLTHSNHYDMARSPSQEVHARARALAGTLGIQWMSSSAKQNRGVGEVFRRIAAEIRAADPNRPRPMQMVPTTVPTAEALTSTRTQMAIPPPKAVQDAAAFASCPRILYVCNSICQSFEPNTPESRKEAAAKALQVFDADDEDSTPAPRSLPAPASPSYDQENVGAGSVKPVVAVPACDCQQRS